MKILFITTDKYPYFGTSTGIIKKLIYEGEMLRHVESISVLTEKSNEKECNYEVINNVNVFRYVSAYSMGIRCVLKDKSINFFKKLDIAASKIFIKCINISGKDSFLKTKHIKEIFNSLKAIHAEQYDVIIPVFGNYDAAIAAINYKSKYQGVHIVLYQVDPFSTNWVVDKCLTSKYRIKEKRLYSLADAIITMPCIYKEVKKIASEEDLYKFNLVELPLVNKRKSEKIDNKHIRPICLFSGLIYRNIRDPKYTIRLFQDIIEKKIVELWFVGVEREELPSEFKDLDIKCFGKLPISEANRVIDEADFLVNIGNKMNNQIPSKIFDYISTGKPIINICKNYDCPTLPYMKKYLLCLNLYEDNSIFFEQENKLKHFIEDNYKKNILYDKIEEIYEECTPIKCSNKVLDVLKKVITNVK